MGQASWALFRFCATRNNLNSIPKQLPINDFSDFRELILKGRFADRYFAHDADLCQKHTCFLIGFCSFKLWLLFFSSFLVGAVCLVPLIVFATQFLWTVYYTLSSRYFIKYCRFWIIPTIASFRGGNHKERWLWRR